MRSKIAATLEKFACAAFAVALGGCAVVPDAAWPTHFDKEVCATYDLEGGLGIDVPYSRLDFTVYGLEVSPPPARESFSAGKRELEFAPGTSAVTVRCRYRVYGRDDAPSRLFPGAKRVTAVDLARVDKH